MTSEQNKKHEKQFNWLFVVQNFEIKSYQDSAARVEIVEPVLASDLVNNHQVLCFDRSYQQDYAALVQQRIDQLTRELKDSPVVIYGAGLHTEQHLTQFSALNVVAIADRNQSLWGTSLSDYPIISPDEIANYGEHAVISSKAFEESILQEMPAKTPNTQWYGLYPQSEQSAFFDNMAASIETSLEKAYRDGEAFDIVFFSPCHPQDSLPAPYWQTLKAKYPKVKFVTLWWDYDELDASPYLVFERDCLTWADCIIENSNGTRLAKMKAQQGVYQDHVGAENVFFHPTVFSPNLFFVDEDEARLNNLEVTLFGSAAGERKQWIELLREKFPLQFKHVGGVLHGEQTLSIESYAEKLRASLITVNTQTYPFREQCKGKVREALACGVLLLEQDNPETRLLLKDGQGVLYFTDRASLTALIEGLLANPERIHQVIGEGQAHWQNRMTAKAWTKEIISRLALA